MYAFRREVAALRAYETSQEVQAIPIKTTSPVGVHGTLRTVACVHEKPILPLEQVGQSSGLKASEPECAPNLIRYMYVVTMVRCTTNDEPHVLKQHSQGTSFDTIDRHKKELIIDQIVDMTFEDANAIKS